MGLAISHRKHQQSSVYFSSISDQQLWGCTLDLSSLCAFSAPTVWHLHREWMYKKQNNPWIILARWTEIWSGRLSQWLNRLELELPGPHLTCVFKSIWQFQKIKTKQRLYSAAKYFMQYWVSLVSVSHALLFPEAKKPYIGRETEVKCSHMWQFSALDGWVRKQLY